MPPSGLPAPHQAQSNSHKPPDTPCQLVQEVPRWECFEFWNGKVHD